MWYRSVSGEIKDRVPTEMNCSFEYVNAYHASIIIIIGIASGTLAAVFAVFKITALIVLQGIIHEIPI